MSNAPVLIEREDGIVTLTLNRPQARNAVSRAMAEGLVAAFDELEHDLDVRVIIVTGAGEKAFCAGADLKERVTMSEPEVRRFVSSLQSTMNRLESMPKPIIAAINGFALGGGLEFAMACDIRVASSTASMGLTETRLAIIPGAGGTQRLPRLIGLARAKELIFTGRRIDGAEAERIGLVTHVVEPSELLAKAKSIALEICGGGPIAVAQAKFAIQQGMQTDLATGLAIERKAYEVLIPTEDRIEALMAFGEKRKPVFRGK
ncbi:MAG: enoyl-CoA hydratase/carnithine racemase [Flavobacteriales bacterium]|jgi:enoyl-CoA hydratase/carnithine racemase